MTPSVIKADEAAKTAASAVAQAAQATLGISMKITAYSSTPDETDDTPFITATGMRVRDGIVATNMLPFGTKVKIPSLFGDKIFVVEDRMAKRMVGVLDIWMPTKNAALRFGVTHANVVLVTDVVVAKK